MTPFNLFQEILNIIDSYHLFQEQHIVKKDKIFFDFLNKNMLDKDLNTNQKEELNTNQKEELNTNQKEELNSDEKEELNNDIKEELNNDEKEELNNDNVYNLKFNKLLKIFYKKLVLKTHPDKTKNKINNAYFIKIHFYYENKIMIGLIYYLLKLNLKTPVLDNDIAHICLNEIYRLNKIIYA